MQTTISNSFYTARSFNSRHTDAAPWTPSVQHLKRTIRKGRRPQTPFPQALAFPRSLIKHIHIYRVRKSVANPGETQPKTAKQKSKSDTTEHKPKVGPSPSQLCPTEKFLLCPAFLVAEFWETGLGV